jgi:hypothetical protein
MAQRPAREKNPATISAYVPTDAALKFRASLGTIGVREHRRVPTQQAVCEALVDYLIKHGETPADSLVEASKPIDRRKKRRAYPAPD